jgi:hypothetical protein
MLLKCEGNFFDKIFYEKTLVGGAGIAKVVA